MATTIDVLVIGAGPSGLMMADILRRSGVNVRIIDKKAGPTRETRAVVVHAKTLELMDRLDLADKAIESGEPMRAIQLFSQGRRVGRFAFQGGKRDKSTPFPFGLIYGQDQTEHLLIQSLTEAGVQIAWHTELLNLEQTSTGTRALVRASDGSEETIEAQWIVGADGLHSPARHALSLGFAGQTYMQTLFIADVDMEWELGPQQGIMNLTREDFFLFVPMHGERQFRLFGTLPPDLVNRDTLTLDDVRRILDTRSGLHIDILKANWISVYHTHLRIAERFRVGRVFLVGDAAHIHSPAGGQGMNTGIGDAFNLAWKLALVIKGYANEALLDSYEAERIPFARSILNGSDLAFQFQAATKPLYQWIKVFMAPTLFNGATLLPFFRRRAFWFLSQLWTNYRNSPAVGETISYKKGPRVGDRAPYGFFETGPDAGKSIFALLKGLDHHLLLFAGGKPRSALSDLRGMEGQLHALLDTYEAPIHLHSISTGNRSLHKIYGADEPGLFLVRPDGHLAYRGRAENLDGLKSYLDKLFTQRESQAQSDTLPISQSSFT